MLPSPMGDTTNDVTIIRKQMTEDISFDIPKFALWLGTLFHKNFLAVNVLL